jgi:flavin reductase (DIM6/NTAB) family NADH-FMN oxidoreductase RutF
VPVDPATFRRATGLFATGVTVVTARLEGVDHAMTANSFTSVSLDPLLVLVSVSKLARWHAAVSGAEYFGVSVLAASQADTSRRFATRGRPLDARAAGYAFHEGPQTGVVLFDDSLATFECCVSDTHDAGDHSIVVGRVLAIDMPEPDADPLIFFRGDYRTLS